MSEIVTGFHIVEGKKVLHACDWRTGAARFPTEWRNDRPWTDEEIAAHKKKRADAQREDDALRARDPFEWMRQMNVRVGAGS